MFVDLSIVTYTVINGTGEQNIGTLLSLHARNKTVILFISITNDAIKSDQCLHRHESGRFTAQTVDVFQLKDELLITRWLTRHFPLDLLMTHVVAL